MIELLFLVKPIIDMLWEYQFLDLFLLIMLGIYVFPRLFHLKLGFSSMFLLLFLLTVLRSFLSQINMETTIVFIKILSAILIFIAARFNRDINKTFRIIKISFLLPVLYILLLAFTNNGYQYWGNIITFVGPYYYKTDLAITIIFSVIFFRESLFFSQSRLLRSITAIYCFGIAPYIVFLANSRMLLLVYGIIILFLFFEQFKYKSKLLTKPVKIILLLVIFVGLFTALNSYNDISNSSEKLEINFDFSEANTQGRSGIWESITENFFDGHLFYILFGYYINADFDFNTFMGNDAHNLYLKLLVNTGLFGLLFYILFIINVLRTIRKIRKVKNVDKQVYYKSTTIFMVFLTFLLCGLTQSNLLFTQSSWYAFYFIGLLYNIRLLKNDEIPKS